MPLSSTPPKLHIRSKTDLAKQISHKGFSKSEAQSLITDVLKNYDRYWRDNLKESNPLKSKWVRNAKGTPLNFLLKKINLMIFVPYDDLIPDFIFGGKKNSSSVKAAKHLQGAKNKQTLLKLDLEKFFEQVTRERVRNLFIHAHQCSFKGAELITKLCCVPLGAKGSGSADAAIARGFATSSRLAVWCNIDLFKKMNELVQKRLAGHDPRIAIYVDDIGITAVKVKKSDLLKVAYDLKYLCENYIRPLKFNDKKMDIKRHDERMEHLGIEFQKNRLTIGKKTKGKKASLKRDFKKSTEPEQRKKNKQRLRGIYEHERYIKRVDEGTV